MDILGWKVYALKTEYDIFYVVCLGLLLYVAVRHELFFISFIDRLGAQNVEQILLL